ncbi:MAG: AAA family ATPase, partial [Nitrososphaerales archaeon]
MAFIKKLEIKGFKSLGDKVVTLNFDKGLTVITGPNGSGKTNIFDAILFAIGENSPKRLRVDKLTSLIYDGGPNGLYKPSNCKVTITFDNTSRTIPIDSDLITISRELKNTGESVYYLNGKSIQKGNLSEILNVGLISTDGLNIVPQGMVTKIAELLPDQKRALIENIAGVAEFDQKKAEAMKQLQNADMKLQVAMARINEIKSRVESLEEERNDQLRLKQLENEIKWLKAVLASKNLINTREKIDKQKQVIKECLIRLEENQRKNSDLKRNIQNLENERNQFISTVMEGPSGKQLEIEFEIVKITNELNRLNSDVENAQRIISRIDETLPNLQKTSENLLKEIEGSKQKIDQLKITLKDLEKAKKEAEKESIKIQNGIKRL